MKILEWDLCKKCVQPHFHICLCQFSFISAFDIFKNNAKNMNKLTENYLSAFFKDIFYSSKSGVLFCFCFFLESLCQAIYYTTHKIWSFTQILKLKVINQLRKDRKINLSSSSSYHFPQYQFCTLALLIIFLYCMLSSGIKVPSTKIATLGKCEQRKL